MSWVTEFPGLKSLGGCLSIVAVALSLTACGGSAPGASSTDTSSAASRIDIALDKTAISNTGVETVAVTITAVNQSGNAVSGAPISVSVDGGGIYAGAASTTDANGQVTGTVGSGSDRSNRMITITAKSGSASASTAVRVTGAQLAVTGTSNVSASAATTITFKLTDSTGAAIAGQTVSVSATGFSPASATGTTNTSGEYLFNVTAPSALGTYTVSGAAAGATASYSVQVGSGAVPAQAATIKSVSIQANPATIKPNLSGSDSLASIRVLVQGDNNAPLQNVRIIFDLPDPNGVGGTLSSGSNVVYTDATGVAQTNYIAGVRTSPTDGVLVRACYSGSDFTAPTCPASVTGTLTVSQQALSVVVGSNGLISSGTDNLTYIKKYVVVVSDAAGNAVSNAQISASVFPTYYYKGTWSIVGSGWASDVALGNRSPACPNEDLNKNGVLDVGEDTNLNGKLDPRIPLTLTKLNGGVTDANGMGQLQIEYPKSFGSWVDVDLTVSVLVSGSEGRWIQSIVHLPVAAEDANNTAADPAFSESPYGTTPSCP